MISVALLKKEKGHKIECDKLKSWEKKVQLCHEF